MSKLVVIALLLLGSTVARAQTTPEEYGAAFYDVGRQRYAASNFEDALDEFELGFARSHEPAFLVNIGQCLRGLDRIDEAAMAYKEFLDLREGDSRLRAEVWEALDELLAQLEGRLFRVARSAIFLRAYLDSGIGAPAERAAAAQTHKELIARLIKVDDTLTLGLGRVHLLQLPDPRSLVYAPSRAGRDLATRTTP